MPRILHIGSNLVVCTHLRHHPARLSIHLRLTAWRHAGWDDARGSSTYIQHSMPALRIAWDHGRHLVPIAALNKPWCVMCGMK